MFNSDSIIKYITIIATLLTITVSGVSFISDISKEVPNPILTWAPEYFEITGGPANQEFKAIVARKKHRDDCSVSGFLLEVKDSNLLTFKAAPSIEKFTGPATNEIDKFGFTFFIQEADVNKVAFGKATLLGQILYKCPEGDVVVLYPPNLNFIIEPPV